MTLNDWLAADSALFRRRVAPSATTEHDAPAELAQYVSCSAAVSAAVVTSAGADMSTLRLCEMTTVTVSAAVIAVGTLAIT